MTTEEKAKAYDEAVNKLRRFMEQGIDPLITRADVQDFFPELKESEDEKIRKELLSFCQNRADNYPNDPKYANIGNWIAWLEKQKELELSEDLGEYIVELSKQFPEVSFAKLSRIAVRVKNWFEKQEENKSTTIDIDKMVSKYANTREDCTHGLPVNCQIRAYRQGINDALKSALNLEKQGEPIDINPSEFDLRLNKLLKQFETLPKEELVSSLGFYLNVVQNDGTYKADEKQGEQKLSDKIEPKFKVKYAGSEYNVLEVKDIAGVTFYGIEDEPNHIDYVKAENCEIIGGYGIKENGSPYPTKPAVFSEPKQEWKQENTGDLTDFESTLFTAFSDAWQQYLVGEEVNVAQWAKEYSAELLEAAKQNPVAWSEEDEVKINRIVACLENLNVADNDILLKDVDWLKSLKDRYIWKPSDEQMDALAWALSLAKNCGEENAFDLRTLYEQLKKLKGE